MLDSAGRAKFLEEVSVSRETIAALDVFAEVLEKWSKTINLVSRSTLSEIWTRHFLDSAQILSHAHQKSGLWVDIGAGGGFPGIVVAILAAQKEMDFAFTLVEADQRKSVFLQTVARELSLPVTVLTQRIEACQPLCADIVSARALAPLKTLLGYADRHLKPTGKALFMKGASYRQEADEALEFWTFRSDEYTSKTDGAAVIISLGDIKRV